MKKLSKLFSRLFPKFVLPRVVATLSLLFIVRFAAVLLNSKSIGRSLLQEVPAITNWQLYLCIFFVFSGLFVIQRLFNKSNHKNKAILLGGYVAYYVLIAILSPHIKAFNYLYLSISNVGVLSSLRNFIVLDLFFRSPYIFWSILWLLITPFIFKGKYGEKLLFIAWGIPLSLISYKLDAINFYAFFFTGATGFIGAITKLKPITNKMPVLTFIFALIAIFGYSNTPFEDNISLVGVIVIICIVWLSALVALNFLRQSSVDESAAVTWFLPFFATVCFSLSVKGFLWGRGYFNTWAMLTSVHYVLGAIVFVLLLVLFTSLISRKFKRISMLIYDSAICFIVLFYTIDLIFYYKTNMHINWMIVQWASAVNDWTVMWASIKPHINVSSFILLLGLPVFYYAGIYFWKSKTSRLLANSDLRYLLIVSLLSSTLLFLPQLENAICEDLKDPIIRMSQSFINNVNINTNLTSIQHLAERNKTLGTEFKVFKKHNKQSYKKYNLILVILESTQNRYLSLFGGKDENCPNLKKYINKMEIFPNFYSNYQESGNARISILTGMYPPYQQLTTFLNPSFAVKSLTEILQENNYDNYFYLSSYYECTNFAAFIRHRGFSKLYDMNNMPNTTLKDKWIWGVKEYATVGNICQLIESKSKDTTEKPFSCIYVPVFPHDPFLPQLGGYSKFNCKEYIASGSHVGLYKNSILYMDAQLARIQNKLEETGLDKQTILAFVTDHGTLLGETGLHGHGWDLSPELTNVPFIIISPNRTSMKVNTTLSSQIDVLPTLLHSMGVDVPEGELYQGQDLHRINEIRKSPIYLSSYNDMAVIKNNKYYLFKQGEFKNYKVFDVNVDERVPKTIFTPLTDTDNEVAKGILENCKEVFKNQKSLIGNYKTYRKEFKSLKLK